MSSLRVGAADVGINPELGSRLQGHISRDGPAVAILDDLSCRVLALEAAGQRALIVACDLLEFQQDFVDRVKAELERKYSLPPDRCLLCATHTHTGPPCIALGTLGADEAYLGRLQDWIVSAASEALARLEPAFLRFGALSALQIGINRRLPGPHGIRMAPNPSGPIDPEAAVMAFERLDGTPLAALVHHSVHPTTLAVSLHVVSSDYPGRARRYMESRLGRGMTALFAQGACGDVRPAVVDESGSFREGTEEDIVDLGRRLGEAFLDAWRSAAAVAVPSVTSSLRSVQLPLGPLPTSEQLEHELRLNLRRARDDTGKTPEAAQTGAPPHGPGDHPAAPEGLAGGPSSWEARHMDQRALRLAAAAWAEQMLVRTQVGSLPTAVRGDIQALAFGRDLVLIGFPGELFCEIGMRIKAQSPFRYTLVCGYAGGTVGYVPTRSAVTEGGYEVNDAHKLYGLPAGFREDVEEVVYREIAALLAGVYEASAGASAGVGKE